MIILQSPWSEPPGQENEDHRVHQHQPGEHEELRGLFSEHLGLGHHDDDDLAEGDGEEPGSLHHGLHGDRGLAVGELHAGHREHDLADVDDDSISNILPRMDWRFKEFPTPGTHKNRFMKVRGYGPDVPGTQLRPMPIGCWAAINEIYILFLYLKDDMRRRILFDSLNI